MPVAALIHKKGTQVAVVAVSKKMKKKKNRQVSSPGNCISPSNGKLYPSILHPLITAETIARLNYNLILYNNDFHFNRI